MKYLSIFMRVALLALGQSLDCHSASEVSLMDMGKISQCITTTKHSKAKTVCIFLGIYCMGKWDLARFEFEDAFRMDIVYCTARLLISTTRVAATLGPTSIANRCYWKICYIVDSRCVLNWSTLNKLKYQWLLEISFVFDEFKKAVTSIIRSMHLL